MGSLRNEKGETGANIEITNCTKSISEANVIKGCMGRTKCWKLGLKNVTPTFRLVTPTVKLTTSHSEIPQESKVCIPIIKSGFKPVKEI